MIRLSIMGTYTLGTYIYKRQVTVVEWVELRPILEVFDKEIEYDIGRRRREPWWRKMAAQKQLSAALEEILETARAWQRESGRCCKGGGGG